MSNKPEPDSRQEPSSRRFRGQFTLGQLFAFMTLGAMSALAVPFTQRHAPFVGTVVVATVILCAGVGTYRGSWRGGTLGFIFGIVLALWVLIFLYAIYAATIGEIVP